MFFKKKRVVQRSTDVPKYLDYPKENDFYLGERSCVWQKSAKVIR